MMLWCNKWYILLNQPGDIGLIIKSCYILEPQDLCLKLSNHSQIGQASQQHYRINRSLSSMRKNFSYLRHLCVQKSCKMQTHIDGLVQERRNSSALALELRLSCTNPFIFAFCKINTSWQVLIFPFCSFQEVGSPRLEVRSLPHLLGYPMDL